MDRSILARPVFRTWATEKGLITASASDDDVRSAVLTALEDDTLSDSEFNQLCEKSHPTPEPANGGPNKGRQKVPNTNPLFKNIGAVGAGGVRVKNASESYCHKKTTAKHAKTGKPVEMFGKDIETQSQLDLAKLGAWMKFCALRGRASVVLTEHEKSLLNEIVDKDAFAGEINGIWVPEVSAEQKAALLNDTVSGGLYANPVWWDNLIIQFPLLHSEIFPAVQVVDMPRGSLVQGASIGNPTVTWSTEGTAVTPFDATALVGQLNTTIFPLEVYVQIGRDWLSDTPADAGSLIVENIGQQFLTQFDYVVVEGNGSTQPQGILNATGTGSVSSDLGTNGPPTVGDYESLMFSVGKQYRRPEFSPMFLGSDVSYRRVRGIAVGPTDERRVFGMDESSYEILEHPYGVNNSIVNSTIIYGAMKRYRFYRRTGTQVTWISGTDATLMASNLDALFVRGRFGGRVMDPNAFSVMTDAQS